MLNGMNSVEDGKLTDVGLGALTRKYHEIIKRINEGSLNFENAITLLQQVVIETKDQPLFLGVIKKTHEIKALEHVIDCGTDPFTPEGWKVEKHDKGGIVRLEKRDDGQLYINGKKIVLYFSKKQINGKTVVGNDLREELSGKKILNAIVLDYLLAHPELIPEDWKGKYVFFWGTVYRDSDGFLYVRYLGWCDGSWYWGYYWLGGDWGSDDPAAVSV